MRDLLFAGEEILAWTNQLHTTVTITGTVTSVKFRTSKLNSFWMPSNQLVRFFGSCRRTNLVGPIIQYLEMSISV